MKKRLIVCLLVCMMALSFAIPAKAAEVAAVAETVYENVEQEITPFNEVTRIYMRVTLEGRLQVRVWSVTRGRWITDWEYVV